jgi:hypothetical protein
VENWARRTDRILVVAGPWPERVGCYGHIVEFEPTAEWPTPMYPWAGLGDGEVVIVIDDDPIGFDTTIMATTGGNWSCVMAAADITVVP